MFKLTFQLQYNDYPADKRDKNVYSRRYTTSEDQPITERFNHTFHS